MPKPIKMSCPNCGAIRFLQQRYFALHPLTEDSRIAGQEVKIDSQGVFPISVIMCEECGLIQLISATVNPKPLVTD